MDKVRSIPTEVGLLHTQYAKKVNKFDKSQQGRSEIAGHLCAATPPPQPLPLRCVAMLTYQALPHIKERLNGCKAFWRKGTPQSGSDALSARQPGSTAGVTLHRCTSSAAAAGSSAVPSSMVCQAGSGCLRCQSSYSLTSSPQTPTSSQGPQTIACRRSGWRSPNCRVTPQSVTEG